jgi:hypothetical protein
MKVFIGKGINFDDVTKGKFKRMHVSLKLRKYVFSSHIKTL